MLPQTHRLQKTQDFQKVYKKGKHLKGRFGKFVILKCEEDKNNGPAQFGIVIPAKLGKAAHRNKAKRQIREIIKKNLDKFPSGLNITIILWSIEFTYPQMEQDFKTILKHHALRTNGNN